MKVAGISVSKNLACIVAVDWWPVVSNYRSPYPSLGDEFRFITGPSTTDPSFVDLLFYTRDDGAAFRGCPYFTAWKSSKDLKMFLHGDVDDSSGEFECLVRDFCKDNGINRVGCSGSAKAISKSGRIAAIDVPQDYDQEILTVLNEVNRNHWPYGLFPAKTLMGWMWSNLPEAKNGEYTDHVLPSDATPAGGRWDGIRAMMNAMVVCKLAWLDATKESREQVARKKALAATTFDYMWIHPNLHTPRMVPVTDDVMLLRNQATFLFLVSANDYWHQVPLPKRDQTEEEKAFARRIGEKKKAIYG